MLCLLILIDQVKRYDESHIHSVITASSAYLSSNNSKESIEGLRRYKPGTGKHFSLYGRPRSLHRAKMKSSPIKPMLAFETSRQQQVAHSWVETRSKFEKTVMLT